MKVSSELDTSVFDKKYFLNLEKVFYLTVLKKLFHPKKQHHRQRHE